MSRTNSPGFGSRPRDRFVSQSRSRSVSPPPNGFKASDEMKRRPYKASPIRKLSPRRIRSPVRGNRSPRRSEYPPRRTNRSFSPSPPRDSRRRHRRSLSPSPRRPQRKVDGDRENPSPNKCIGIFGLAKNTEEQDLYDIFDKFGKIDKVQLVMDKYTGQSQGFGFIYFESIDAATRAKEEVSGVMIGGRSVRLDYSITKRAHTPTPGIYLGKKSRRERPDDYGDEGGRRRERSRKPRSRSAYRRSRSRSFRAVYSRRNR